MPTQHRGIETERVYLELGWQSHCAAGCLTGKNQSLPQYLSQYWSGLLWGHMWAYKPRGSPPMRSLRLAPPLARGRGVRNLPTPPLAESFMGLSVPVRVFMVTDGVS